MTPSTKKKPLTTSRKLVATVDQPDPPKARSTLPDPKGRKRAIAEKTRKR